VRAFLLWAMMSALLAGCGGIPPTQEMSDARQALQIAHDIGANLRFVDSYATAMEHLHEAEQGLSLHQHLYARHHALTAKKIALDIHHITDILQRAEQALNQATIWQVSPLQGEQRLTQALRLAREGYPGHAMAMAEVLEKECTIAINQAQLSTARKQVQCWLLQSLLPAQQNILKQAEKALTEQNGATALEQLKLLASSALNHTAPCLKSAPLGAEPR